MECTRTTDNQIKQEKKQTAPQKKWSRQRRYVTPLVGKNKHSRGITVGGSPDFRIFKVRISTLSRPVPPDRLNKEHLKVGEKITNILPFFLLAHDDKPLDLGDPIRSLDLGEPTKKWLKHVKTDEVYDITLWLWLT